MFDIGFMELLLISIVALLVLGPEKLPQAVRTAALWIGRARRSFNKVRSEIEREINADDIRRQLHNESIMSDLDKAKQKAGRLTRDTKDSFSKLEKDVRHGLDDKTETGKDPGADSSTADRKAGTGETSTDSATGTPEDDQATTGSHGAGDGPDQNRDTGQEQEQEQEPVTDFYNNPPEKVTVQGRQFRAGKDDDDRA